MIRLILAFIITCISFVKSYSQKTIVYDSINHKALPFVNIKLKKEGLYSNGLGFFLKPKTNRDTLTFSIIGYFTKTIPLDKVKDTVFLSPKTYQIQPIIIVKKKKTITLTPPKKAFYGSWPLMNKFELVCTIFPKEKYTNYFIDELAIPINHNELKKYKAKKQLKSVARINIYTIKNKKIDSLIFNKIVNVNFVKKDKIILNLRDEIIQLDKNGLGIGVEFLGHINSKGNFTKEKHFIRPRLTEKINKNYSETTYLRYVFNLKQQTEEISNIIKKGGMVKDDYKVNLSIGMTISK